jgi:(2Fe-2S) ferredoxin
MSLYKKHVFVCENTRDEKDSRGSCSHKGSSQFREILKETISEKGLKSKIRINKAGCLGTCNQGISMVIYPDGIWYGKVSEQDIEEIVEKTLLKDELIDRLLMPFMRRKKQA